MKKILVVLLAVLLFALPVMAQEKDNPIVTNWEGDMELTEEHNENSVFGAFASEEGHSIFAQLLNYGVDTLEEVAMFEKEQRGDDMHFAGYYVLNGLNAIIFMDSESDVLVANIETSAPQNFIKITISPISDENLNALSGYILASIQPYSEE